MRRRVGLGVTLVLLLVIAYAALGQVTPGSLPVLTDQHAFVVAHVSSVSHVVLVGTSGGSVPISTIAHISSVTHVVLAGTSGGAIPITTIGHITSVTHISATGTPWGFNMALAIRCVNTGATAFESCGGTVTSDTVNVFHQSTIRHVSSVTHVAAADGGLVIRDPINLGARARVDHTGALVTSATVTVTTDNVNVFHQSTIRHVSSVTHVGGTVSLVDRAGNYMGVPSGNPLLVNIQHISSVLHVRIHGFGFHNTNVVEPSTEAIRVTNVTHVTVMGTLSHISQQLHMANMHSSGSLRAWTISTCGTSASLAIATNRVRRDLILQNIGTRPIFIGYGTTGHVALTTSNGFMLHAGEGTGGSASQIPSALGRLELRDYTGPIACISGDAGQTMNVLEILKN